MLQGCDPRPFVRETGPEQTAKAQAKAMSQSSPLLLGKQLPQIPPLMLTVEIPRLSTGVLVAADSRCHHSLAKFRSSQYTTTTTASSFSRADNDFAALRSAMKDDNTQASSVRTFKATFQTLEAQYREGLWFHFTASEQLGCSMSTATMRLDAQ